MGDSRDIGHVQKPTFRVGEMIQVHIPGETSAIGRFGIILSVHDAVGGPRYDIQVGGVGKKVGVRECDISSEKKSCPLEGTPAISSSTVYTGHRTLDRITEKAGAKNNEADACSGLEACPCDEQPGVVPRGSSRNRLGGYFGLCGSPRPGPNPGGARRVDMPNDDTDMPSAMCLTESRTGN